MKLSTPLTFLRKFRKVSKSIMFPKQPLFTFFLSIAKFNVDVMGYTAEDDDMLCLKLKVDFMKPFPRFW